MAVTIQFSQGAVEPLHLSNAMMAVLMDTLCIAGSLIARTESEINILLKLAEQDASVLGDGLNGFDIGVLLSGFDAFESGNFLYRVSSATADTATLNMLPYKTNIELLKNAAEHFGKLALAFASTGSAKLLSIPAKVKPHQQCSLHNIFIGRYGCIVCNNN